MQKLKIFLVICVLVISNKVNADNKKYLSLKSTNSELNKKNHTTNALLKSYLELSSFRHKVLSQNIANINTPAYEAEDVSTPKGYEDLTTKGEVTNGISLTKTAANHISDDGRRTKKGKFTSHKIKDPYEVKPNGNNVSLPQQMTKISQNQHDYNMAVKSYSTTNSLISAVLGK